MSNIFQQILALRPLPANDMGEAVEKSIDLPVVDNTELRTQLISRIENLTRELIQEICSGQLSRGSLLTKPQFSALTITTMCKAHRLLLRNTTVTRRSFYYDLKSGQTADLASDQGSVDRAVNSVANLLNCAPWDLNLLATSKGLVAGQLTLTLANDQVIECTVPGGALIPQIISNVTSVRAKATFVLIVEKDTVFQKLLEENCTSFLKCILVTGKGYPDVATRMLVKLLSERMQLPVYVLVDADPFGVDIMCVYRFGSAALSKENDSLACTNVRWLGVLPSELIALGAKTVPLTQLDISRLAAIERRPYVNERFLKELKIMRQGKAAIEEICSLTNFLTRTYLFCKIKGGDYI